MSSKDIAEHREDVVHVHLGTKAVEASESAACRSCKSKLVVLLTLLWVVQHVIGLCGLLEFLLSLFVARVSVRVIFDGNLSVCLLDVIFRGRLG